MRNTKNKILMIILIVIGILAILGGVLAYLFLATDIFKTGQELFAKYLIQNMGDIKEISNVGNLNELESQLKQSKYEENMNISYSEIGDTDPLVQISVDTQKDAIAGKIYKIFGLDFKGAEEKMELEYMKEDDMYSLRFTNAVKQFLSVENNNLKEFAKKLGMDEEAIQNIPDKIDFEKLKFDELKFTEEEINTEANKYSNLLYNNIEKSKYQKNKNVVITVNGKTITTNSYVLTLSMQDIKTVLTKTLETLKEDEIILGKLQKLDNMLAEYEFDPIKDSFIEEIQSMIDTLNKEETTEEEIVEDVMEEEIKEESNIVITVYEANKQTVRIKAEQNSESVMIDTIREGTKKQIDISSISMDTENTQYSNKVSYVKENNNKLNIIYTNIDGEEQNSANINIEVVETENNTKINALIEIEDIQINITRNVKIVDEIDYNVILDNSNNVILNNKSLEQIANRFNVLGERLIVEYVEPIETALENIMSLMYMNLIYDETINTDMSEAEIASFNSKFLAYEGEHVPEAQVNALLNTVFTNNDQETLNISNAHYVTVSGDITLEPYAIEVTQARKGTYYSVECRTDADGCINEIVITEDMDLNN